MVSIGEVKIILILIYSQKLGSFCFLRVLTLAGDNASLCGALQSWYPMMLPMSELDLREYSVKLRTPPHTCTYTCLLQHPDLACTPSLASPSTAFLLWGVGPSEPCTHFCDHLYIFTAIQFKRISHLVCRLSTFAQCVPPEHRRQLLNIF